MSESKTKSTVAAEEGNKYTFELEGIQDVEKNLVEAAKYAFSSVAKGFDAYLTAREKSVTDKKYGAVVDFVPNAAEGAKAFAQEYGNVFTSAANAFTDLITFPLPKKKS